MQNFHEEEQDKMKAIGDQDGMADLMTSSQYHHHHHHQSIAASAACCQMLRARHNFHQSADDAAYTGSWTFSVPASVSCSWQDHHQSSTMSEGILIFDLTANIIAYPLSK